MEEKKVLVSRSISLVDITQVALMAAMVFVATSVIHIPSYNGVIHAGDSMVFVAAYFLGKKKGMVASALGMCLFDIVHGYLLWAPFTLIIKGVMALIAAYIIYKGEKYSIIRNGISFVISGIFMIAAYFISGAFIKLVFSNEALSFKQALIISSYDIPGNILQIVVGIAIAIPLIHALKNVIKK